MNESRGESSTGLTNVSLPATQTQATGDDQGITFHPGGFEHNERELSTQAGQATPLGGVDDSEFASIRDELEQTLEALRRSEKSQGDVVREIVKVIDATGFSQSFKNFAIENWIGRAFKAKSHIEFRVERGNTLTAGNQLSQTLPSGANSEPSCIAIGGGRGLDPKATHPGGDELERVPGVRNPSPEDAEASQFIADAV
ncbi:hypothetical protein C0991_004661 [Blastosporella zonata]|nr:hypothetical protein C0991_004661 [Blastosporella zonata]